MTMTQLTQSDAAPFPVGQPINPDSINLPPTHSLDITHLLGMT